MARNPWVYSSLAVGLLLVGWSVGPVLAHHAERFCDCPIDLVFGGSLRHPETRVLLVPPSHGDLGNPNGSSAVDYVNATLRGLYKWDTVLNQFAANHTNMSYLSQIKVEVEVFNRTQGVQSAEGYDVVLGYVASLDQFRGLAGHLDPVSVVMENDTETMQKALDEIGVGHLVHAPGRVILLSLFASSPRAHQTQPDFPEVNDLYAVTLHEFAHTFGLGHTLTRTNASTNPQKYDLMNSPATFVYGDNMTFGDGGERTPIICISSLDLYGMAHLYRWLPNGSWEPSFGNVSRPAWLNYTMYC
ncbi:MAG: hypothetical protein ACT4PT_14180 [Methanobacteriota archaeon]